MAITKETLVDKIEVLEMGQVQVRTATKIVEDGTELSRSFHRHVLQPFISVYKTKDSGDGKTSVPDLDDDGKIINTRDQIATSFANLINFGRPS